MTLADELERRAKSDNPHSVVRFVFANLPAIIAALRAQEWQPIETAPRDGRRALVYRPLAQNSNDEPIAVKCLIQTDDGCWDSTVPPGAEPCNPTDGYCHVTHWMPLSTPPAHDKGEPKP